jgi:seryl-tRNA synthetase
MNPLVPQTAGLMAVQESIKAVSNMVSEIAHYKRAVAELECQRQQMHEQAKLIRAEIELNHKKEIKRIDALSSAFKACLKHNQQFIKLQKKQQDHAQEQCLMILNLIAQEQDPTNKTALMSMWQEMLKQIELNREETSRLNQILMDAHHQFGIDLAAPQLDLKDVS